MARQAELREPLLEFKSRDGKGVYTQFSHRASISVFVPVILRRLILHANTALYTNV